MPKQKDVERQLQGRGYISEMEGRELCNDCGKYYNNCVDNIRLLGNRETGKYYAEYREF